MKEHRWQESLAWNFMRKIAHGGTSESHPLYGRFMSHLSDMIFKWDATDYATYYNNMTLIACSHLCEVEKGVY